MVLTHHTHGSSVRYWLVCTNLVRESIELDRCRVHPDFVCQTLHPVEKLLIALLLFLWYVLEYHLPELTKDGSFDVLGRLVNMFYPAEIEFSLQDFDLRALHFKLKFFLWVGMWVQGRILLNLVRFTDDGMLENAFAKD